MDASKVVHFESFKENVGKIRLGRKVCVVPEMNRIATHLFASAFRSFGVQARVLETNKGMELGKAFTSGKECYPCQITLGDILYFLEEEKERLGEAFAPENYVYFLPESDGPCRFGMYNKYQRMVLDSLPGLDKVKISSVSTADAYSLDGMIPKEKVLDFKKCGYFSLIVGDVLDRLLWRIRPYEREAGAADALMERAMGRLGDVFEAHGQAKDFDRILDALEEIIREGKALVDPNLPPKPLIGVVGEIFLRMHTGANQDLIRVLEAYGAEVVNASMGEWVNYVSYDGVRLAKTKCRYGLRRLSLGEVKAGARELLSYGADLAYKEFRQRQVYRRAESLIDLQKDHKVAHLEHLLKEHDVYSFDIGTEACLSISSILHYAQHGANGIVNVYPFTCMPSTTTSAIVKPLLAEMKVPYLDTPYDSAIQPGREAAIRTFMYQAHQHFKRHGRKG
jgi:predicted nucleotide-binding protein (sugar kinase/HSP70/actin superfamily)